MEMLKCVCLLGLEPLENLGIDAARPDFWRAWLEWQSHEATQGGRSFASPPGEPVPEAGSVPVPWVRDWLPAVPHHCHQRAVLPTRRPAASTAPAGAWFLTYLRTGWSTTGNFSMRCEPYGERGWWREFLALTRKGLFGCVWHCFSSSHLSVQTDTRTVPKHALACTHRRTRPPPPPPREAFFLYWDFWWTADFQQLVLLKWRKKAAAAGEGFNPREAAKGSCWQSSFSKATTEGDTGYYTSFIKFKRHLLNWRTSSFPITRAMQPLTTISNICRNVLFGNQAIHAAAAALPISRAGNLAHLNATGSLQYCRLVGV